MLNFDWKNSIFHDAGGDCVYGFFGEFSTSSAYIYKP
jgi:hypothetical protein